MKTTDTQFKNDPRYVMKDVVDSWHRRIDASKASEHRKGFMNTAGMCNSFFSGAMGIMWEDKFRKQYLGDMPAPRFKITIAKAFELVAIMGPSVCWDYPGRVVKSRKRKPLARSLFGGKEDPTADQRYQLYLEDLQREQDVVDCRKQLMDEYLNYGQREQPSGLLAEANKAITEAIVKGRGCLQVEPYTFPGSERVLTRAEFFSVDDLFLDPDSKRADLHDCYWMARRHITPYRELEKRFDLPKDSLKDKTSHESINSLSVNHSDAEQTKRLNGLTNDNIEWYEIFSKQGVGTRGLNSRERLDEVFDEVVGDYAYMCVCKRVDYPLNLPPDKLKKDPKIAKEALSWPVPFWKDSRWPIAMLDFHERPDSAWPLAPMAMGLGELIFLNIIISCLCERVYESSRTIGLAAKSLGSDVIDRLKNADFSGWIEVPGEITEKMGQLLTYIQTPGISNDIYAMIDRVSEMFDRRTGLTDLLYGMNPGGKVSRSAADINIKQEAVSVRPDWMARCFENFMTEVANLDRIAAGWCVRGGDLLELFGSDGAQMWDQLIADEDPEVYVRQMRTTIEANSIKKPNKFRDNANIQQTVGYILPIFKEFWEKYGDAGPLNRYLGKMADAMEQDPEDWTLPDTPPPQPEQPDPSQEQMQQLQMQSLQENVRGKQLRNGKLESESAPPLDAPIPSGPSMGSEQYPVEPEMPVAQDSNPLDMQAQLLRMAATGQL